MLAGCAAGTGRPSCRQSKYSVFIFCDQYIYIYIYIFSVVYLFRSLIYQYCIFIQITYTCIISIYIHQYFAPRGRAGLRVVEGRQNRVLELSTYIYIYIHIYIYIYRERERERYRYVSVNIYIYIYILYIYIYIYIERERERYIYLCYCPEGRTASYEGKSIMKGNPP